MYWYSLILDYELDEDGLGAMFALFWFAIRTPAVDAILTFWGITRPAVAGGIFVEVKLISGRGGAAVISVTLTVRTPGVTGVKFSESVEILFGIVGFTG